MKRKSTRRWPRLALLLAASVLSGGCARSAKQGPEEAGLYSDWLGRDELRKDPQLAAAPIYRMKIAIRDDLAAFSGSLAVLYANRQTFSLDRIVFQLFPNYTPGSLTIRNVLAGGSPVKPEYRNGQGALVAMLAEPLEAGKRIEIAVEYTVEVPVGSDGAYGSLALSDGVLSLAFAHPTIPAYEAWEGGPPVTYGDFLANDVAFYSVEVSYPSAVKLIAPGKILRETISGNRSEMAFILGPARDLYMAAARDWEKFETNQDGVTVEIYAPPGGGGSSNKAREAAVLALESFGRRWGTYPFARLVFVAVPFSAYGGEFPGVIVLSRRLFDPSFSDRGINAAVLLEATVAHEVAHQWFYGIVGNDQLQEPWLDEAMAQYATVLYYEDRYGGGDGYLRSLEDRWERVKKADIPIDLPVAEYTTDEYGAIIYGRAPLFLKALSDRIGEKDFAKLLAEYSRRFRWKIASTEDFLSLAEQSCGCSLDDLYQEWGLRLK